MTRELGWFNLVTVDEIRPVDGIEDSMCVLMISGFRAIVETHSAVTMDKDEFRVG